ncbi:hypothetical protein AB0L57_16665 [Nocardia sp. NPDC052254]|uniref:hypothetical protein n=1 Tax=Nocardia sp. NPDC052254 TaxID=3155681 RepID=UPI003415DA1F
MGIKKIAATSALLAAALGLNTATANAAPEATDAVGYHVTTTETGTVIATDAGSMSTDHGVFTIRAADGTVLAGTELFFRVDDFVFPIQARVHDRTATLTPEFDREHAVYQPVAMPFEDSAPWKTPYDREQAAWSRLTSTLGAGATIGTLVGGIGGGALGCLLGGVAGATIAAATIVGMFGPFVPAAVVGCIAGVVAIGAVGTLAGQLLVTAPVAVMAAVQYFTTTNAPMPAK